MYCDSDKLMIYWFYKVSRSISNVHNQKLREYNLTSSQVAVLTLLWQKDGLTQKELQHILQMKPASISGLIDKLEEKQFVKRIQDGQDARIKRIFLTKQGIDMKHINIETLNQIDNKIIDGIYSVNKKELLNILRKICDNLE